VAKHLTPALNFFHLQATMPILIVSSDESFVVDHSSLVEQVEWSFMSCKMSRNFRLSIKVRDNVDRAPNHETNTKRTQNFNLHQKVTQLSAALRPLLISENFLSLYKYQKFIQEEIGA
jgi:PhoPQ-activated pathogenicity-related protein